MSTISNERLEELANGDMEVWYSESQSMARELLALRKEREKEESAVCPKCGNTGLADSGGVQPWGEPILIECDCTAPPAPDIADDSLPYDPQIAEYEQMMEAEQAQAGATAQQFESLAGKVVGGSDGFECTPVADLYELLTKCGECYDYTTSAKVAADWIKEGYSAREYVKLDRLQEAMTQGSSGEADGWIPCSERMPDLKQEVLCVNRWGDFEVAVYDVGYITGEPFFATIDGEFHPTHWQPLPEPQCK
ncbi:TPA: DUF551 domain-containing protein [Cronobacter sakazakii]|nr:DUF551 domain-containing protein [Cronobacter sakazakii]